MNINIMEIIEANTDALHQRFGANVNWAAAEEAASLIERFDLSDYALIELMEAISENGLHAVEEWLKQEHFPIDYSSSYYFGEEGDLPF